MPWDEGLVNSLVYDAPDPTRRPGARLRAAINEALTLALERIPHVFVLGQGVDDPGGDVRHDERPARSDSGRQRVFDTPLSEEAMMGVSTGAAMNGMRPVYMHNRPDFVLLAFNQLVTHAAKFHFMDNGQTTVPMVVWAAIGRGWGSGAQHSQAIQGMLLGVPGLEDRHAEHAVRRERACCSSAILDNNPVCVFEHRWLMKKDGVVPGGPLSRADRQGHLPPARRRRDHRRRLARDRARGCRRANQLAAEGIDAEVIDLRTIKPLDERRSFSSRSRKTGRLLVVDTGWMKGGVCAEIGCLAAEKGFGDLKAPVARVGLAGYSDAGRLHARAVLLSRRRPHRRRGPRTGRRPRAPQV